VEPGAHERRDRARVRDHVACPLGKSIFNCNAPDRGNMEVLAKYGTKEQ
jgi:hypothetical protein